MTTFRALGLTAAQAALELRYRYNAPAWEAICIADFAEQGGVEVWFTDIPSMEGMYWRNGARILVSSHRPSGRQNFTIAHELAHHTFNHGTKIDELISGAGTSRTKTEERLADLFAAHLLMPKAAVQKGFRSRGFDCQAANPFECYITSQWLGVGYTALVRQLCSTLKLIPHGTQQRLLKLRPRQIREAAVPESAQVALFVVDRNWTGRTLDVEVDDIVASADSLIIDGDCLEKFSSSSGPFRSLYRAVKPGQNRVRDTSGEWAVFARVCRRGYVGRNIFRFLEE